MARFMYFVLYDQARYRQKGEAVCATMQICAGCIFGGTGQGMNWIPWFKVEESV
jgi:hypothetical protein